MWGSTQRQWGHVGDDNYYITLNDKGDGDLRDIKVINQGLAHLGFEVDDLNCIVERLTERGFEIDTIARADPYRQSIYFCDPAGFQFEFLQYSSNKPEEKNMYGGESGELTKNSHLNIK
jgi:catechol 2,3-dioxygenase-like lactoylglutathione lyase family enzyme